MLPDGGLFPVVRSAFSAGYSPHPVLLRMRSPAHAGQRTPACIVRRFRSGTADRHNP